MPFTNSFYHGDDHTPHKQTEVDAGKACTAAFAGKLRDEYWSEDNDVDLAQIWFSKIILAIKYKCAEGEEKLTVSNQDRDDVCLVNFKPDTNPYPSTFNLRIKTRINLVIIALRKLGYKVYERNGSILVCWFEHCTLKNEFIEK